MAKINENKEKNTKTMQEFQTAPEAFHVCKNGNEILMTKMGTKLMI